ncbi:methyltransferase domain-containing protein [Oscillatoria sp. HE19RPO]|uniref:class I SAM-dependent methyltransferase n=1 Tax=Oscillatoria sp. HE19RPO TaxID=2954806 RepID=UPI0020C30C32|nr:methyltransferase domain-containing protein [Oscillatoria sp. HE19RPO]
MNQVKLHIGGTEIKPDWKIVDIEDRPEVDFISDASNLSQFESDSVDVIYASHVLEHFHHSLNNELIDTLKEWHRVLKPGGKLLLSVPDLKALCWLYLHPNMTPIERLHLMRILYGGQINQYDVHKVGFDAETLAFYLEEVGFKDYEPVSEFNLFNDCSSLRILDTLISLNVIATK